MEDSQTFSQSQAPAASGTPASTISKPPLEEDPPAKHDSILEKLEQRMSDLSGNEQEDDESFDGIPPPQLGPTGGGLQKVSVAQIRARSREMTQITRSQLFSRVNPQ